MPTSARAGTPTAPAHPFIDHSSVPAISLLPEFILIVLINLTFCRIHAQKNEFFALVTSGEKIFCKNFPQNVQNRMVSIHIYYRGKVPKNNTPTRQNSACATPTARNMNANLGHDMPCQKLSLMFQSNCPTVDYRHSLYICFPSRPTGGRGVAACSVPPAGLKLNALF